MEVMYPVVGGIVMMVAQVWKKFGFRHELIPLLNLLVSAAVSGLILTDLELGERLISGLVIGLCASGVYDVGKYLSCKKY